SCFAKSIAIARPIPREAPVTNAKDVTNMVKQTVDTFGQVDILVNNAGVTKDNLLMRMKEEEWDTVINTNLKGVFLCTKAVSRFMMRQRHGRIVNIASFAEVFVNPITPALAKELASRNITVNAIAPGFIATDMTDVLDENIKAEMLKLIPAAQFGEAQDIA
ncbi:SDR family NAD(P)-dependent oxidoreductase, partial [Bacillus sp. D-CC]